MAGETLLFDVGNTRIKWGIIRGDGSSELTKTGAISHAALRAKGYESLTKRLPRKATDALACNVAGADVGTRLARAIGIHIAGDLRFVRSERSRLGVTNGYSQPRTLGVDRWVAMIGARSLFSQALVVVDAGTAVTIDALNRDGQHQGGFILPGLDLMASSLARDTSDIGATSGRRSASNGEFGRTTRRAVAAGSLAAACGAVEHAVSLLKSRSGRPRIVLTGGDASRMLAVLDADAEHRPTLVLDGLACLAVTTGNAA